MIKIFRPLTLMLLSAISICPAVAQVGGSKPDIARAADGVGKSVGVFGCAAPGSKQKIGAAAGAVVGGVVGNRVIKGKRVLGTVIGGAAGAAAGSWLGCKLQTNDQKKAQKALEQAAANGRDQQWSNSETGASGRASVVSNAGVNGLRFPSNILPYSQYDDRAGIFAPNGRVNLRASPTTASDIVGTLTGEDAVQVVAGAANAPWLLVAEEGVARGYVSATLMTQRSAAIVSDCRLIRQEIETRSDGKTTQDLKACPDGSGGWMISNT